MRIHARVLLPTLHPNWGAIYLASHGQQRDLRAGHPEVAVRCGDRIRCARTRGIWYPSDEGACASVVPISMPNSSAGCRACERPSPAPVHTVIRLRSSPLRSIDYESNYSFSLFRVYRGVYSVAVQSFAYRRFVKYSTANNNFAATIRLVQGLVGLRGPMR